MIGNAVFATTVIFLALAIYLLQECRFLIPYRHVLFFNPPTSPALRCPSACVWAPPARRRSLPVFLPAER